MPNRGEQNKSSPIKELLSRKKLPKKLNINANADLVREKSNSNTQLAFDSQSNLGNLKTRRSGSFSEITSKINSNEVVHKIKPHFTNYTEELKTFSVKVENLIKSKMSDFDMNLALKIIPDFNGDSTSLHKFLSCCELVHDPLKPAEKLKFLKFIKVKLSGKAYEIVQYHDWDNWEALKVEIQIQCSETRSIEHLQVELVNIKQRRGEDVKAFASRVEKLLMLLNEACIRSEGKAAANYVKSINSKTALKAFQEGLLDDFKLIIKACRYTKLSDAISKALEEEVAVKQSNFLSTSLTSFGLRQNKNNRNFKCHYCHKVGHSFENCFARQRSQNPAIQSSAKHNTNSYSKVPFQNSSSTSNQLTPYQNRNHHIALTCAYCKCPGHHIQECRKKKAADEWLAKHQVENSINSGNADGLKTNSNTRSSPTVKRVECSNNQNNYVTYDLNILFSQNEDPSCLNIRNQPDFERVCGTIAESLLENNLKSCQESIHLDPVVNHNSDTSTKSLQSEVLNNNCIKSNQYQNHFSKSTENFFINPYSHTYPMINNESSILITNNFQDKRFVKLALDITIPDTTLFLIDTGADISILKVGVIKDETNCNSDLKCTIKGISSELIETLALCNGNIKLSKSSSINHYFQIVPDKFPIPCSGIIGKDFLTNNKCKLDFSKQTLEIPSSSSSIFLPLCSRFSKTINPPILQYPNFEKQFFITCDASDVALGAVLSQKVNGSDLPIAYASRTLNCTERDKYPTIEKELLAIVFAVDQFRPYIYGTKFILITDHKPLIWIKNMKNPTSRLIRWKFKLAEYEYSIIHKPGKLNKNADALSRITIDDTSKTTPNVNVITRSKSKLQQQNPTTANNTENFPDNSVTKSNTSTSNPHHLLSTSDSINNIANTSIPSYANELKSQTNSSRLEQTTPNIKHVTDEKEINQILKEFHTCPLGGHQGFTRTYRRIKSYFYFDKMLSIIKNFIKNCEFCQKNKHSRTTKMPMQITTTSKFPFQKIFLDIVGPISPVTFSNNKFILTIQDDLTKYSLGIAIENAEAETIAKAMVHSFICIYGAPTSILTDQGSNFMGEVFKKICKLFKIKKFNTTAYHPETNGALERSHKTIGDYLRNFCEKDKNNWDTWIPYAMFTYNTTPHCTTGYMPFELIFGRKPNIPNSIVNQVDVQYNYDDYIFDVRFHLQNSYEIARQNILKSKEKSKINYDIRANPAIFKINDLVWLKNETRKSKLSPFWLGPYRIVSINSDVNSTIKIGNSLRMVHNNRLKLST